MLKRTLQVHIVYPPSLMGNFQIRLSDWGASATTALDSNGASMHVPLHPYLQAQPGLIGDKKNNNNGFCPLYRLKAPDDLFACNTPIDEDASMGSEFRLPAAFDEILTKSGLVDAEVQCHHLQLMYT